MEENKDICAMLELMILPAFAAQTGKIVSVNQAAREFQFSEGMDLSGLFLTGAEEYAEFNGGCLYLQLNCSGTPVGASVTRMGGLDIFLLDPDSADDALRAMALASRELRQPLSSLIAIAENLLPHTLSAQDARSVELLARMSRELYQMQRILGNMSDAGQSTSLFHPEYRNIAQIFDDIFERAGVLLETANTRLHYTGLTKDVYGMIDALQMERAVLNILSNALKFLPQEGTIQASLVQRGTSLMLSISDNGSGIGDSVLGSLFSRYLRQPGLEDTRHGLGLGMVMIRAAASNHGGTVLVDRPEKTGTRVTLTMKICKAPQSQLRSPLTDLSGGRSQALIELSEHLPVSVYQKEL